MTWSKSLVRSASTSLKGMMYSRGLKSKIRKEKKVKGGLYRTDVVKRKRHIYNCRNLT